MKLRRLLAVFVCGSALCGFGQDTDFGRRVSAEVTRPRIVSKTEPEYAEQARAAGIQGKVVIQLSVGVDGFAHDLRVVRTLGSLDQRAMEAVRQWRFQPAAKYGQPVPWDATVEVDFRLMEPVGPDSGFRSFARHQYERAINSINFNLELSQKYSNEIERQQKAQTDENRRVMLAKDVEKLSSEIKTATDQLPVLEYRLAHADDCARIYLETARKTALTISESSLVQLCQSADLYPPQK